FNFYNYTDSKANGITMLELVLARHGQSYGNLDRSLGSNTELTDLGRKQAKRLGNWLVKQGYNFITFYCSTLRRAQQTAEIINEHFGLEIRFEKDLRESEVLYLDVLPQRTNPLSIDPQSSFKAEYEQFYERVKRVTARILNENAEGQILVVGHGGSLATMLRCIFGAHALLIRTEQAAVHCLRWENNRWNLQYVNRQEHLLDNQ
ncbi:MAG: histidine phosphatase family protein, partial [Candidatus Hodarchaeota archaeon]